MKFDVLSNKLEKSCLSWGKRLETGHVIELSRKHWLCSHSCNHPCNAKRIAAANSFWKHSPSVKPMVCFTLFHNLPIQGMGWKEGMLCSHWNDPSGNTSGLPSATGTAGVKFHTIWKVRLLYIFPCQFPTHRTGCCVLLCLMKLLEKGCWIFYRGCLHLRLWD